MPDFLMIMMGSAAQGDWATYIDKLVDSGSLRGGSSLGNGIVVTKSQLDTASTITGFIRLTVDDLDGAKDLLVGNPLYEAGGSVQILEEIPD